MKRLSSFLSAAALSLVFPISALAQTPWTGRCLGSYYGIANAGDVPTIQGLECLFFNILQVIAAIAGLVFFVMFISGGFRYLFSGNDPKKVAAAGSTLTSAIIGLVGVIASYFVLQLIYNFTGVNVINFIIPG